MVRLAIALELPDEAAVRSVALGLKLLCEEHDGWHLVSFGLASLVPPCPECQAPMVFDSQLEEFVCHHPG